MKVCKKIYEYCNILTDSNLIDNFLTDSNLIDNLLENNECEDV